MAGIVGEVLERLETGPAPRGDNSVTTLARVLVLQFFELFGLATRCGLAG